MQLQLAGKHNEGEHVEPHHVEDGHDELVLNVFFHFIPLKCISTWLDIIIDTRYCT